eukprot:TRINITY_DN11684_c0_g1_i2.p1 TRINITY_DN11684_c0_g1~~TRINITY_DN11684_c0_g1_i2.p1  ORF type:complete len:222 (-),score=54.51 TRINITY_DN11684_c0_g1_i2:30-656(-)
MRSIAGIFATLVAMVVELRCATGAIQANEKETLERAFGEEDADEEMTDLEEEESIDSLSDDGAGDALEEADEDEEDENSDACPKPFSTKCATATCVCCDGPGEGDCVACKEGYTCSDHDKDGAGECKKGTDGSARCHQPERNLDEFVEANGDEDDFYDIGEHDDQEEHRDTNADDEYPEREANEDTHSDEADIFETDSGSRRTDGDEL